MKHFIEAMKNARVQLLIPARVVDGKQLPEVLLPRFHYYPDELGIKKWTRHGIFVDRGTEDSYEFWQRPVIELDDEHWEACQADVNFVSMLKKGTYVVIDALPARFRSQGEEDRMLLAKRTAQLKAAGIEPAELGDDLSDEALEVLTKPDDPKSGGTAA